MISGYSILLVRPKFRFSLWAMVFLCSCLSPQRSRCDYVGIMGSIGLPPPIGSKPKMSVFDFLPKSSASLGYFWICVLFEVSMYQSDWETPTGILWFTWATWLFAYGHPEAEIGIPCRIRSKYEAHLPYPYFTFPAS